MRLRISKLSQIFFCLIGVIVMSCASTPKYPLSDHYDGEHFFNPGRPPQKSFFEFLKWQWTKDKKEWPSKVQNTATPVLSQNLSTEDLSATFVNHASYLLQLGKINILTDPVFSERTSPVQWAGPRRVRPPGLELNQLPEIHIVLISHGHYDHLDEGSVRELARKFNPLFLTPLGNGQYLKEYGAEKVIELDWWNQAETVFSDLDIHLVPAQHWTQRGLFGRNKALWGGFYLVYKNFRIYFAGDTGYNQNLFYSIRDKFGDPSLSLLPIGAYEPRWFMQDQHMNPDDAVLAHRDLNSKFSLGIHFGTFQLTDEGFSEPATDLRNALEKYKVNPSEFIAPENGQTHQF